MRSAVRARVASIGRSRPAVGAVAGSTECTAAVVLQASSESKAPGCGNIAVGLGGCVTALQAEAFLSQACR